MNSQRAIKGNLVLSSRFVLLACLLWIVIAEVITVYGASDIGMWLHAILLSLLLVVGFLEKSRPLARMWLCLAFAPLIRVISLATPLSNFRLVYWYMLTGIPLFLAAFAALRYFRLPPERFGLKAGWMPGQILVGISGLALGYVEYLILRPKPLVSEGSFLALLNALLILVIFTGLVEEIIFRGLMQHAMEWVLGNVGIVLVAVVFSALHLGYRSIADMAFVFVVALYFGFYVQKSRSILGVTLAHGLINVALFLIFPFLLGPSIAARDDGLRGVLSPRMPSPTVTPTPFHPYTPTPFLPDQPTPGALGTPSPGSTPGSPTDDAGVLYHRRGGAPTSISRQYRKAVSVPLGWNSYPWMETSWYRKNEYQEDYQHILIYSIASQFDIQYSPTACFTRARARFILGVGRLRNPCSVNSMLRVLEAFHEEKIACANPYPGVTYHCLIDCGV